MLYFEFFQWCARNLKNQFVNAVRISALRKKLIFQFHKAI